MAAQVGRPTRVDEAIDTGFPIARRQYDADDHFQVVRGGCGHRQ
jgi:hypothetical protein